MNDLVTVIIPAYNRSKVIKASIDSVLCQSYQNFEIIIINDGSQDNTVEIVSHLAQQESRIIYIENKTNLGAQKARNRGIKSAKGDWITFLDSDDQLLPHSLEKRLNLALLEKVKVVHSECYVVRNEEELKWFGVPAMQGNIYSNLLFSPGPVFPALFIARDVFEKIGYLDENIIAYQEWDTVIRLSKFYSFGFVKEPTFIYDCRGQDTISKNLLKGVTGYKQIVRKHFKEIFKQGGMRAISDHFLVIAEQYKNIDSSQAIYYKLLAFLYFPNFIKIFILKINKYFSPIFKKL